MYIYSPDKNPNDKKIQDRFARLGVIANILKDAEKRKQSVPSLRIVNLSELTPPPTATTFSMTMACPSGEVSTLRLASGKMTFR